MTLKRFLVLSLIGVALHAIASMEVDPHQVLKQFEPSSRGSRMTVVSLPERKKVAAAAVQGVDPSQVKREDALAWAKLFSLAGEDVKAGQAATRFLEGGTSPHDKYVAQSFLLLQAKAEKNAEKMLSLLDEIKPPEKPTILQHIQTFVDACIPTIQEKMGESRALEVLNRLEKMAPEGLMEDRYNAPMLDLTQYKIIQGRMGVYERMGKPEEAVKLLDEAITKFKHNKDLVTTMQTKRGTMTLMSASAPELNVLNKIGVFESISNLKGKVVLLDFFAHWCGPCIRAFPDLRQTLSDLKASGLEIVGVTAFYGTFGTERGLSPEQEAGKMLEFMRDHKIDWPVVFVDQSTLSRYGVSSLPNLILLDRKGKVIHTETGYSPELFKKTRAKVEEALAQG